MSDHNPRRDPDCPDCPGEFQYVEQVVDERGRLVSRYVCSICSREEAVA